MTPPRENWLTQIYGWLLRLLPEDFYREFGEDMRQDFADIARDASHNPWLQVRTLAIGVWDVGVHAVSARASDGDMKTGDTTRGGEGMMGTTKMWGLDLRYALRGLIRQPGATVTVIITLTVCIGANVAIAGVAKQLILAPLPIADDAYVMRVYETRPRVGRDRNVVSYPDLADWKQRNRSFVGMAGWTGSSVQLTGSDEPVQINGVAVTWDFHEVTGVPFALGRAFTREDATPDGADVIILSNEIWRARFGADPEILGRLVRVDGGPATVVGVSAAGSRFPAWADFWTPLADNPYEYGRGGHWLSVLGRLAPGVTLEQARSDMQRVALELEAEYPDANDGHYANVFPIRNEELGDLRRAMILLASAVGFLLLIACANLANMRLAQLVSRRREFAIRRAMGASRGRVLRQTLTETAVIAAIGSTLGLVIALLALGAIDLPTILGVGWVQSPSLDPGLLVIAGGATVITIFLVGLAPARRSSAPGLGEELRDGDARGTAGAAGSRTRGLLVSAQVALTVVLLVGAGLSLRSLLELGSVDPGFEPTGVAIGSIGLPELRYPDGRDRSRALQEMLQVTRQLPGVEVAGMTNAAPLSGMDAGRFFTVVGRAQPESRDDMNAALRVVTPGYIEAMEIPLLVGRLFNDADGPEDDDPVMLVNQAMADRHWPDGEAVGARVVTAYQGVDTFTVVGIVGDVRHRSLDSDLQPELYLNALQRPPERVMLVARSTGDPGVLVAALRDAVRQVDADQPLSDLRTMDDALRGSLQRPRVLFRTIAAFAVVALFLSMIGIYGVVAYSVRHRTREIGVRMALGASTPTVVGHIIRTGASPVVLGMAVGIIGAAWLSSLMKGMIFGITPTDPLTYLAVTGLLGLVSCAALWTPARMATRVDPARSLQEPL